MANVANKVKLGIFVVVVLTLFLIGLFLLGALKFLEPKVSFMTVTKSSVQGLDKGAEVKFRGVKIGQVTEIKISPSTDLILIYMDLTPKAVDYDLVRGDGLNYDHIEKFLNAEIKKGLRCQLRYGSAVTGKLYVEISYFDAKRYPMETITLPAVHPFYLPSVPPVLFDNIMDTIQQSLVKISKIDFLRISNEVEQLLNTANRIIDEPSIREIIQEIKSISGNLNDISARLKDALTQEKIEKLVADIDNAVESIQRLAGRVKDVIEKTDLPETAARARSLMATSENSLRVILPLRRDAQNTLNNIDETLSSVRDLTNYLSKDPAALLRGKQEHEVVKP